MLLQRPSTATPQRAASGRPAHLQAKWPTANHTEKPAPQTSRPPLVYAATKAWSGPAAYRLNVNMNAKKMLPLFTTLVCLALTGGCTPSPSPKTMIVKTFTPASCIRCGALGNVAVFTGNSAAEETAVLFCDNCALQAIRLMPPCPHLVIAVASPTGSAKTAGPVQREYQVLEVDELANVAKLKVVGGSSAPSGLARTVRYDAIPKHARIVGATCRVVGTPRELELFELSGPRTD